MYEGAFCPCVKSIVVKIFRTFAFNVRHAFISASSIKQNSFFLWINLFCPVSIIGFVQSTNRNYRKWRVLSILVTTFIVTSVAQIPIRLPTQTAVLMNALDQQYIKNNLH